jgi:hypothetical protein
MKPLAAHNQDKLLDYAYGELSAPEAKSLEEHLQYCSECTQALGSIQKVRRTMSQLPPASAPSAGLDSLIAYARQSARRAQSKAPARWTRLWLPGAAASLAALGLVVVVSNQVHRVADLSRPAPMAPAEPEPRGPQDLALREAPPPPSKADPWTSERLKGDGKAVDFAERAKKKFSGSTPHRRAPSKETDEPQSKDEAVSQGITEGAPAAASEAATAGGQLDRRSASELAYEKPKASIVAGSRAREESAALRASQGAPSAPTVDPVNAAVSDRPNEIEGIRRTLSSKELSGPQRAALLNRLCALLYEAGRGSEADSTCDAVIREFPKTDFAASARRLKAQYAPAGAGPEN